jgi:hypothetical protein
MANVESRPPAIHTTPDRRRYELGVVMVCVVTAAVTELAAAVVTPGVHPATDQRQAVRTAGRDHAH